MINTKKSNVPYFKDFRRTTDGVMVADMGFKKQLRALNPEYDVVWDAASHKWEIWIFPGQGKRRKKLLNNRAQHVMTIETKDKTFREVGADILMKLRAGDTTKYSLEELCAYFDQMDENIRRSHAKTFMSYIRDVSNDFIKYMTGYSKNVPVQIKPKDQKYLLNLGKASPTKPQIFKPRMTHKIAHVVGGEDA